MRLLTADGLDAAVDAAADEDSAEAWEEARDQGLVEVLDSELTSTMIMVNQVSKKPFRPSGSS